MSDIKLFAGYYVYFQENLSDNDKITFFNFIKESTENQVSHLLMTGKMVSEEILQEKLPVGSPKYAEYSNDLEKVLGSFSGYSAKDSLNALTRVIMKSEDRAYGIGKSHGMLTIGGIALAALAAALAYKVYKNYLSKAAKACKGKKGVEKQQCMRQAKMGARKEKITSLIKAQGACSKSKHPEKCVAKLKLKIAKEKVSMQKIKY